MCLLDSFAFYQLGFLDPQAASDLAFVPITGMPTVTTGFLYRSDLEPGGQERSFMRALKARFNQQFSSYAHERCDTAAKRQRG